MTQLWCPCKAVFQPLVLPPCLSLLCMISARGEVRRLLPVGLGACGKSSRQGLRTHLLSVNLGPLARGDAGLVRGESWMKGSGVIRISQRWGFREPGGKCPWMEGPKEAMGGLSRTRLCVTLWDQVVRDGDLKRLVIEGARFFLVFLLLESPFFPSPSYNLLTGELWTSSQSWNPVSTTISDLPSHSSRSLPFPHLWSLESSFCTAGRAELSPNLPDVRLLKATWLYTG